VTILDSLAQHSDGAPIGIYDAHGNACRSIGRDELLSRGAGIAQYLAESGIEPGDRVLTLLPNSAEFVFTLIGTWMAGGTIVPVAHAVQARLGELWKRNLREILSAAAPAVVVGTDRSMRFLSETCSGAMPYRTLTAEDLMEKAAARYRTPEPLFRSGPGSIAHIQFTSGSTGIPKGVLIRHDQIVANIRAIADAFETHAEDRFLSWLPIHHDMGFIGGLLCPLLWNVPQVLVPTEAFVRNPAIWLQLVSAHRITMGAAPPSSLDLLAERVSDERLRGIDLSSWRYVSIGAEPIFIDRLDKFNERFRHYGLSPEVMSPAYGMAEATLAVTACGPMDTPRAIWVAADLLASDRAIECAEPGAPGAVAITCVGRPLRNFDVGIADDQGELLPEGRHGRVFIKGESVTQGYLGGAERWDADRWLDTGDLGFMLEGELYITGRKKDLIIRGGQNFHPQYIEQEVSAFDGIKSGKVVAFSFLNHRLGREEVVVLVEHRFMANGAAGDVVATLRGRIAKGAGIQVDKVELVKPGSIPVTTSGKVMRGKCRELYLAGKLGVRGH
jgi:acyl-CoA synthetase (AMP-forming)/AMP-acid ligase II